MLENEETLQHSFYLENNYKTVTENVGCKVTRPMENPQPTDTGISGKLDKAVGKAIQNRKHEILQICRETGYSIEEVIQLALKNGLEITAKSVSPGRRFKVLNEEVCENE